MRDKAVVYLTIAVIFLLATNTFFLVNNRDLKDQIAVDEANIRAYQDTLRTYEDEFNQTIARYALQERINTDSIFKLNHTLQEANNDRRAKIRIITNLQIKIDSLLRESDADTDVLTPDSIRIASVTLDEPPIEGKITATIPPLPATVRFRTELVVSPIDLSYALTCDRDRNAQVNISGPTWARLTMAPSLVDPGVCRSPSASFFTFKPTFGGVTVGAIAGVLAGLIIGAGL